MTINQPFRDRKTGEIFVIADFINYNGFVIIESTEKMYRLFMHMQDFFSKYEETTDKVDYISTYKVIQVGSTGV